MNKRIICIALGAALCTASAEAQDSSVVSFHVAAGAAHRVGLSGYGVRDVAPMYDLGIDVGSTTYHTWFRADVWHVSYDTPFDYVPPTSGIDNIAVLPEGKGIDISGATVGVVLRERPASARGGYLVVTGGFARSAPEQPTSNLIGSTFIDAVARVDAGYGVPVAHLVLFLDASALTIPAREKAGRVLATLMLGVGTR